MSTAYFDKHRERLDAAVAACASREYYSAFDESPSPRVYGESAAAEGKAAFEAWLGATFPLDSPGSGDDAWRPSGRRTASTSACRTRASRTSTYCWPRPRRA